MTQQFTSEYWFSHALRAAPRALPEYRGIKAPLRTLREAARAVYIARTLEAKARSRATREAHDAALSSLREAQIAAINPGS